jgi:hypothetical protein
MAGKRRNICIALAVGLSITIAGAFAFHDTSEAAMQAMGAVGFFTTFVVFHFLDERDRRRRRERAQ